VEKLTLRNYIQHLENQDELVKITVPVSANLEIAGILKKLEPKPVLFEDVMGSDFRVVGNIFANKKAIADYLGISTSEMIPYLTKAIDNPTKPEIITNAPCQEIEMNPPDLEKIPILTHTKYDGGPYITSGVVIINDNEWGQNMSFHRAMRIAKNKLVMRIVKGRHFHRYLEKHEELDAVFCIGNSANVLLAGATSVDININELEIANSLQSLNVVKAKTADIYIPAECEFVIEGTVSINELHEEGPFIDLTETMDIVRNEPVFTVKKITHRKDAIWQGLLSGGLEHKVLMGMPREPTIYREVNNAGVKCLDVNLNPGGCSWLHAIVKIKKEKEDDGLKTINAAFKGHKSLKHCFVVDEDIDIYNPLDVEWSMATRFQADKDLYIIGKEPGSSLDPSAEPRTKLTTKVGFDLTMPLDPEKRKHSLRIDYPEVDLKKYLDHL